MKKSRSALIALSLIAAFALYMLGVTQYTYHLGSLTIQIYPAAFLGLLGLWMLIRPAIKSH